MHSGLYESHLPVTDLRRSIDFYEKVLDFRLAFGTRDAAGALLLYERGERRWMLGLYTVDSIEHRHPAEFHLAFRMEGVPAEDLVDLLRARGVEPEHPETAPQTGRMNEPIVHGWMPAASLFFRDPDGHLLELIAELDEEPRPQVAYCPLREWRTGAG